MRGKRQWVVEDIYSGKSRKFDVGVRELVSHKTSLGVFARGGLSVVISVLVVIAVVQAGNITPPVGVPSANFYTLGEIYNLITGNTPATEGSHSFAFSDSLTGTGRTITEVYAALSSLVDGSKVMQGTTYLGIAGTIASRGNFSLLASTSDQAVTVGYYSGGTLAGDADLVAGKIKSGVTLFGVLGDYPSATNTLPGDTGATDATAAELCNGTEAWTSAGALLTGTFLPGAASISVGNTYCGIAGTLLKDLFNGTGTNFLGGIQSSGGFDDYNAGAAPPGNRYAKGWTQCVAGNNYCGTSDSGADAKDNSTGLIWSLPCKGNGCSSFSDFTIVASGQYTWNNSGTPGSPATATGNNGRTASQLCSDKAGWFLPHQKQLIQAYTDGAYGNLEASGFTRGYWSATTVSTNINNAWSTSVSTGGTGSNLKTAAGYVRCVR